MNNYNDIIDDPIEKWKKRRTRKINKGLKIFNRYILLPCLAYLFIFIGYYYFTEPELFYYQKIECGFGYCAPANHTGMKWYGVEIIEPFVIPEVSEQEFDRREIKGGIVELSSMLALMLSGVGIWLKFKEKKKEKIKNE